MSTKPPGLESEPGTTPGDFRDEFPPDEGHGSDRLHLTRKATWTRQHGINSTSEWYCRVCHSRVTVTPDLLEAGHSHGCPHRDDSLPRDIPIRGRPARVCPACGQSGDDHLDACSKEGHVCPTCRDDGFVSKATMKQHHTLVHGKELREHRCASCQRYFKSDRDQKYCCYECYSDSRGPSSVDSECESCGETFSAANWRNQRFCSMECAEAEGYGAGRPGDYVNCAHCGEQFYRKPSSDAVYCGRECSNEGRREREVRTCPVCEGEFETTLSQDRTYCSRDCYETDTRTKETRQCKNCGEPYQTIPSKDAKFCGRSCYMDYRRNGGDAA